MSKRLLVGGRGVLIWHVLYIKEVERNRKIETEKMQEKRKKNKECNK
jgi:hypothetical protein